MQPDEYSSVLRGQRAGAVRQANVSQHRGVPVQLH